MLPETLFTWFLGENYIGTHYYICLFLIGFGLTIPYYLLVNYLFYHAKNKLIASISLMSTGVYFGGVVCQRIARFTMDTVCHDCRQRSDFADFVLLCTRVKIIVQAALC